MQQVTKKLISSEGTLDSEFKRADDSMAIVGNKFLTDEQESMQSQGRISKLSSRKQHGHFNSTKGSEDSSTTIGCSEVRDLQPIDPIITITGKPSNTEANNHNPQKILNKYGK